MSNRFNTFAPRQFDLTILNKLIEEKQRGLDPFVVLVEEPHLFLDRYDGLTKEGYKRHPSHPMLHLGSVVQLPLLKPKKMVEQEKEAVAIEVERQYRAEILEEQNEALRRMQIRLLEEAKDKERKAQEEAEQVAAEAALIEARVILGLTEGDA